MLFKGVDEQVEFRLELAFIFSPAFVLRICFSSSLRRFIGPL
jgi:hypothetical protein